MCCCDSAAIEIHQIKSLGMLRFTCKASFASGYIDGSDHNMRMLIKYSNYDWTVAANSIYELLQFQFQFQIFFVSVRVLDQQPNSAFYLVDSLALMIYSAFVNFYYFHFELLYSLRE
jgi:hypothetical protein